MPANRRLSEPVPTAAAPAPSVVVVSANSCWNIVNFRAGLVRALVADGRRVVVMAGPDRYADRIAGLGAHYVPIAIHSSGLSPIADARLLLSYLAELRRVRARAFLGFTVKPNVYGSLAARLLGLRTINNVSGLGTAFLGGGLLRRLVSGLYRVALARSATVFFQNDDDRALFLAERLLQPSQARLLAGSGVDLDHFTPAAAPTGPERRFLLVARLLWDKGVGEFVEAARLVRARHPDVRFQLLGPIGADNRSAVPRATLDGWLAEGVVDYLGESDDVRPFVAAADCVVLPSYREGLPRSLVEAAAMARPVIASDVPGCRQAVEPGVTGLLCEARSARSLADAVERMAGLSATARNKMGRAARQKAVREFDQRLVARAYLDALGPDGS